MPPLKLDRILAPTDLSPFAERAVSYAHSLAEKFGAELHVLHVAGDLTEAARLHGTTGVNEPTGDDDHDRWLAALLGEPGTVRRIEAVRIGTDVADTICQYARSQGADMIVLATHGRTGLSHLLMGSVAESVLRAAPCPVLVLRPQS